MRLEDDVPHIQACCSKCGFLFDMKFGFDCPACHHIGVKWARQIKCVTCGDTGDVNGEPCEGCTYVPTMLNSALCDAIDPTMQARSYPNPVDLDPGITQDIAWLDKLYDLEDNR